MDLKAIFGSEALTREQFQEKTKDMKLVDLTAGEFVDKRKFDSEHAELVKAKETIKALEASKGDTAALEAKIQKYKEADNLIFFISLSPFKF